jgi:hypothetical protein
VTADAYFERVSDRTFRPTPHTGGAWTEAEQHISPLHGLVVHAIEQHVAAADDGRTTSRLGFDILGPVGYDDFDITVEVLRPGRTVELVGATVTSRGREVLHARCWRTERFDTDAVAGGTPRPLPPPGDVPVWDAGSLWPGGYIASLDLRRADDAAPGRGTAWIASRVALLAGEPVSPLADFVALVDTANGIAVRESPDEWLFPNVDLTIHLHRSPERGWVGLDTSVAFGADGLGLTESVLHDERGPVGRAAQALTIRRR